MWDRLEEQIRKGKEEARLAEVVREARAAAVPWKVLEDISGLSRTWLHKLATGAARPRHHRGGGASAA